MEPVTGTSLRRSARTGTNVRRITTAPSMEIIAASHVVIFPMPRTGALWPDPRPRAPAGLVAEDHVQVRYPVAALLPLLVGDNEQVLRLLAPSAWATRSAKPKRFASLVVLARLQPPQASPQPRKGPVSSPSSLNPRRHGLAFSCVQIVQRSCS